ncbi:MAG: rhodanese-like domain-containing protein [Elusimicrobia bacterium]|nr:rhodanese-like domain-containing protein [Elusimicrobiota bacterium]
MGLLKKVFSPLCLLLGLSLGCAAKDKKWVDVTAVEAAALMKDPNVFLLDVRTAEEYADRHIPKSVLVPVQVLDQQIERLPQNKSQPILLYCRSGNRSKTAAHLLYDKGYRNLYNLKGGILSWPEKE